MVINGIAIRHFGLSTKLWVCLAFVLQSSVKQIHMFSLESHADPCVWLVHTGRCIRHRHDYGAIILLGM